MQERVGLGINLQKLTASVSCTMNRTILVEVVLLEGLLGIVMMLQQVSSNEVEQLLIDRANAHGANAQEVVRVARCENRNLVPGLTNFGGSGAIGIFQWMSGRGNHWDRTPAYRDLGIDIHQAYRTGDSNALYYDIDMGAWSFSPEAQRMYPGNKFGWSCY